LAVALVLAKTAPTMCRVSAATLIKGDDNPGQLIAVPTFSPVTTPNRSLAYDAKMLAAVRSGVSQLFCRQAPLHIVIFLRRPERRKDGRHLLSQP